MSFYDSLRPASWRGFEFPVISDGKSFGRDVKRHKIINSAPQYEDTGEKENIFNVEAVIGGNDDFKAQADEFEALLAQKGIGKLILPHTDEMNAVVMDARRTHSSDEVGIIRFQISFEAVDEKIKAPVGVNSSYQLLQATDKSNTASFNDFLEAYQDSMPDFITAEVISQMGDFTQGLNGLLKRVNIVLNPPVFNPSAGSTIGKQIIDMFGDLVPYEEPIDYSIAFENEPEDNTDFISVINALSSQATQSVYSENENSKRANNLKAVDLFSRISTVNAAAKASLSASYDSQQQALTTKTHLFSVIKKIRSETGERHWSGAYFALGDLMSAVNRDIDNKLGRLPLTAIIKPQTTKSALAIAHRLFGHTPNQVIDLANDMIKRNGVIHPSFVPPQELEVLVDA